MLTDTNSCMMNQREATMKGKLMEQVLAIVTQRVYVLVLHLESRIRCGNCSPSSLLAVWSQWGIPQQIPKGECLAVPRQDGIDFSQVCHWCTCMVPSHSSNALALSATPITPLRHSIAMLLEGGKLVVENGWLMTSKTSVLSDNLPQWMGQVPLKSVMIERVSRGDSLFCHSSINSHVS